MAIYAEHRSMAIAHMSQQRKYEFLPYTPNLLSIVRIINMR